MITKVTPYATNTMNYAQGTQKQAFAGGIEHSNMSKKQKAIVLASSVAGVATVMAALAKCKGFSLNPVKILKTPIENWAIFKSTPIEKAINFEEPQILAVASGSIVGGFIGGAIVDDKANLKAKKREALNQMLGNIIVPVACVGVGARIYKNFADKIDNIIPQIKSNKRIAQITNKILKVIPNASLTVAFLGIGIYAGNRVSNYINEKIYNKKVDRNIRATDFAPHVDDLCMATSMMNKGNTFASRVARVIPVALLVPGYQTGIAQDNK